MSKTDPIQRVMKMVESEEKKDSQQVEKIKQSYIREISKIKKEDIFPITKKVGLWERIKMVIWGS